MNRTLLIAVLAPALVGAACGDEAAVGAASSGQSIRSLRATQTGTSPTRSRRYNTKASAATGSVSVGVNGAGGLGAWPRGGW